VFGAIALSERPSAHFSDGVAWRNSRRRVEAIKQRHFAPRDDVEAERDSPDGSRLAEYLLPWAARLPVDGFQDPTDRRTEHVRQARLRQDGIATDTTHSGDIFMQRVST
jgi:hypothetical protein